MWPFRRFNLLGKCEGHDLIVKCLRKEASLIYIYIEEETKMGATCYVKDTVPDKLLKRLLYDFWCICIASDHSDLNYDPFLNFWLWLIKSKVDILLLKLINTVCYFTSNDERLPYCMKQKIVGLLLTEMKTLFLS